AGASRTRPGELICRRRCAGDTPNVAVRARRRGRPARARAENRAHNHGWKRDSDCANGAAACARRVLILAQTATARRSDLTAVPSARWLGGEVDGLGFAALAAEAVAEPDQAETGREDQQVDDAVGEGVEVGDLGGEGGGAAADPFAQQLHRLEREHERVDRDVRDERGEPVADEEADRERDEEHEDEFHASNPAREKGSGLPGQHRTFAWTLPTCWHGYARRPRSGIMRGCPCAGPLRFPWRSTWPVRRCRRSSRRSRAAVTAPPSSRWACSCSACRSRWAAC